METNNHSEPADPLASREPIAPAVQLRVIGDTLVLHLIAADDLGASVVYLPAERISNWCDLAGGGSNVKALEGNYTVDFDVRESPEQIATMRAGAVEWKETRLAAGLVQAQAALVQMNAGRLVVPR